ncbi:AAA family ATPase [Sphingomonas sp. SAFR-052]|uniref:AAA family ATPase n=1 Tax=Sphingomonas sp. SAFR-052 TaxID=3436867 RepID=UPI003F7EFC84
MAIDFDAIRRDYPLETVVAKVVQLRRSGANKVACCPFHADKTPSLVLYKDQTYHCFGCSAHGDVLDFVAGTQRTSISCAIRYLTGGNAPVLDEIDQQRRAQEMRQREAAQAKHAQDAVQGARSRWQRALPVDGTENGYLTRKNVAPYGCRREGDNLLVPIFDEQGLIASVQSIPPEAGGKKLFHAGAPVKGGTFTIGDAKDGPIVIAEGFATGATVQMATGHLVVIGFSKGALVRTAELAAKRYPGRAIIIAADVNGVDEAQAASDAVGGRVALPDLQGADGTDFNDQAGHYGLDDVAAVFVDRAPLPLAVLSPADWQGIKPPVREWKVEGLVPNHQATLLTGAGAAGKSLLSQLLCTCAGMGMPFLGVNVDRCPTLYITCEDDNDELHRRQQAICDGLEMPLGATRGHVHLLSLYGEMGNELCTFDDKRTLVTAKRYREIVQTAQALGVRLIVLDNTSHMFTGNENARSEVAAFVNLANAMARDIDGAVILVGFPNKAGDSYSGSTAWENQVRSRLFLETPKNEDGIVIDPDYRVLRNEKANYARKGSEIGFMWQNGTFVLPPKAEDGAPAGPQFTDAHAWAALQEIDARWRASNPFSAAYNSPERYLGNWLQYRFKLSGKAASAQIKRWGAAGIIQTETYDTRNGKQGLRVVNWPDRPCGSAGEGL